MRLLLNISVALVCCMVGLTARAQDSPASAVTAEILDHLAGTWVLSGTIGGAHTTHDVEAAWMLNHEYLHIHETSREKNPDGRPAYEAVVLIGWDPKAKEYDCLWLDTTSGGGLSGHGIGRGNREGDSVPFLFVLSPSSSLHTTFSYRSESDTWRWIIDDETNGKTDRFADVMLTRAK